MSEVTNSYFCSSTDYFGSDVSEGHYNSVPSAEACQKDCQVDWDCENLDRNVGGDVNFQKKTSSQNASSGHDMLDTIMMRMKMRMVVVIMMLITTTQSHNHSSKNESLGFFLPKRRLPNASSGPGMRATMAPAGISLQQTLWVTYIFLYFYLYFPVFPGNF